MLHLDDGFDEEFKEGLMRRRGKWDDNQILSIWNLEPEGASIENNPFNGAWKEPFPGFSAFLPQSSATMDRARNSLSLASVSLFLCSSVSPAWSIWLVNSLKILCISVKYTTWGEQKQRLWAKREKVFALIDWDRLSFDASGKFHLAFTYTCLMMPLQLLLMRTD